MIRESFVVIAAMTLLGVRTMAASEDLLSDPKLGSTASYLLQVAGNGENGLKNFEFINQKELQEVLRYVHRDELGSLDLFKIKSGIQGTPRYAQLMPEQQMDLNRVIRDILDVRARMEEHENYDHYHCRFALSDDPYDELSEASFTKNPERYRGEIPDETIRAAMQGRGERSVIGLCWFKKESDRLVAWTKELRTGKSASVFADP